MNHVLLDVGALQAVLHVEHLQHINESLLEGRGHHDIDGMTDGTKPSPEVVVVTLLV